MMRGASWLSSLCFEIFRVQFSHMCYNSKFRIKFQNDIIGEILHETFPRRNLIQRITFLSNA